jgi:hypothetical protein
MVPPFFLCPIQTNLHLKNISVFYSLFYKCIPIKFMHFSYFHAFQFLCSKEALRSGYHKWRHSFRQVICACQDKDRNFSLCISVILIYKVILANYSYFSKYKSSRSHFTCYHKLRCISTSLAIMTLFGCSVFFLNTSNWARAIHTCEIS